MMVTVRTPYRLPIVGGLSDVEPYASRFGGRTLSVTLDRYVHVTVQPSLDGRWSLTLDGHTTHFQEPSEAPIEAVAGVLTRHGPEEPLAVTVRNDLAPAGGLAASGALTVGLVHALALHEGAQLNAAELAARAAQVEVFDLNGASGYHDSAICAHGGLRQFTYDAQGAHLDTWQANQRAWQTLKQTVRVFDTGRQTPSGPSLRKLAASMGTKIPALERMKVAVTVAGDALNAGDAAGLAHAVRLQQTEKMGLAGNFTSPDVAALVRAFDTRGVAVQIPGGKIGRYLFTCDPSGRHDAYGDLLPNATPVAAGFAALGSEATTT